jgi:outer membrane beta-barrel protein/TonB-dependent receptor-like protein
MKSSIITALIMLTGFFVSAQKNPIPIEIKCPSDFVSCESDTNARNILIERTQNGKTESVGLYETIGCNFSVDAALEPGIYYLTVSGVAFETTKTTFEVTAQTQNLSVEVLLSQKTNALNEVTIFGSRKQYIKVESDKTTVRVRENGMLNSGSSLDAVKRLPGVVKGPGGNLSLNGKGVKIYIDGAPSTLTGTDLENYLATLPANAIEKVELIYNPGAAYDANSSGSVINIITSSKKMKGINASFNINYNFNEYQKPSPQILLNGKEGNLSWQTMIGYNYIEGENRNRTLTEFTSFNPPKTLDNDNKVVMTFRNFYWRTGANYKLNEKSNLLFNYNLNLGNDRFVETQSTQAVDIDFTNDGIVKKKNSNNEISLQYKLKLDTIGTNLDITAYSNLLRQDRVREAASNDNGTNSFTNSDADFTIDNYYLKYDFAFPFKNDLSINTGGKYNVVKVRDLGRYNFDSPSDAIFDNGNFATLIDFDYSEKNLAFYSEIRKKYKKFSFTAGLRFEDYRVERAASTIADKINFNNSNFFPSVNVMYEINKNMNITSSYSRRISQPDYFMIDPNSSNIYNKYNTSEGNATLAPIFFNNYELKFSAFDYVQIGTNYMNIKDNTQFIIEADDDELISNRAFISIRKTEIFNAYVNFPIPLDYFIKGAAEFAKRINTIDKMNYIFVNINYGKMMTEGYSNGFRNHGLVTYGAQSQILLPWGITNNMNYFIMPKGVFEIYRIDKPIQQFDISFNKDFMDKKLKLGLHCFDVFNANEVNAFVKGRNVDTHFYEKQDSRTFRISLTWNFGNQKLQKENTDINVDKTNQGGGMLK